MTISEVLASGSFWIAAAIIQALQQTSGVVAGHLTPRLLASPFGKSILATQNYAFGALLALPPWLPGERYGQRLMWGLGSGALSHVLYAVLIKRVETVVKAAKSDDDATTTT